MRVGFIGLGQMGRAMALRLLETGHELIAWNRSPAADQLTIWSLAGREASEMKAPPTVRTAPRIIPRNMRMCCTPLLKPRPTVAG